MNGWAQRHVFPAASPPSLRELLEVFKPHGFSVLDVENLRSHYVETLHDWLSRYETHAEAVRARSGEVFMRTSALSISLPPSRHSRPVGCSSSRYSWAVPGTTTSPRHGVPLEISPVPRTTGVRRCGR